MFHGNVDNSVVNRYVLVYTLLWAWILDCKPKLLWDDQLGNTEAYVYEAYRQAALCFASILEHGRSFLRQAD